MEYADDAFQRRKLVPLFETGPASAAVRIHLLGGFRVFVNDLVVPDAAWRLGKARSLIQLLCLTPGHRLHREQVMEVFWPHLAPKVAAGNFYQVVHAARRALSTAEAAFGQPAQILHLRQQVVDLRPPHLWVDSEAFNLAAAAARQTSNPASCREAIELYGGELLPEYPYDEWLVEPRRALRDTAVALLFHEARLHEERGADSMACAALSQILEHEPANEQAHADLIRLYAQLGRSSLALDQYRRLSEVLARELGEQPDQSITRLCEEIAAGRTHADVRTINDADEPAPASGNPKRPLTSFIGRRRELETVLTAVQQQRIVTLTGAGGCGKTRLALAAAQMLADSFPDGVSLLELATLTEPGHVLKTAATSLGLIEQAERSLEAMLLETLRERQLLLILDNCEHLIEACASFSATVLGACPRVRILATSRERLHVSGEFVWRVPPMSLPEQEAATSPAQVEQSEAIQLFVERARMAQPTFEIDAENAGAVAAICHQVDGLPLAIELAAAWLPLLPPAALLARLEHRLPVLVGGPRDLPARHQTMQDTIAWSYDLLTAREQGLLRQLSVFTGGWSIEAAEALCRSEGEELAVLQGLAALVNKSLLQIAEDGQGSIAEPRLMMLETIREYARERLCEAGEEAAAREQHAGIYQSLAELAEAKHEGAAYEIWLDRLQVEHSNLRAALEWQLTTCPEAGLRLAGNLWRYWRVRGHHVEGRSWLEQLLARTSEPTEHRAMALIGAGILAVDTGDDVAARSFFEESRSIANLIQDRRTTGLALLYLGSLSRREGHYPEAHSLLEDALRLLEAEEQQWDATTCLRELGNVARLTGDYPRARRLIEESLTRARGFGSIRSIGWVLSDLAHLARCEGDTDRAMVVLEESVSLFRAGSDRFDLPWAVARLGDLARIHGDITRARTLLNESMAIFQRTGSSIGSVTVLHIFGMTTACQGRYADAVRLLAAAATHDPAMAMLYLPERNDRDAAIEMARHALGDEAFAKAWQVGAAMTLDEAMIAARSG